jgi:hypothetical protein
MAAGRSDHVWALDYQHDLTVDGRQLRFLNVIDEFTREALATRPPRSWNADQTTGLLDELITTIGRKPEHIRMDNRTRIDQSGPSRLGALRLGRRRIHRSRRTVGKRILRILQWTRSRRIPDHRDLR